MKIGLKRAYYAKQLTDVPGVSTTYEAPVALPHIQQVSVNPRVNRTQVPGDDLVLEDISECLGADVTIQRKETTPAEEAELLGRRVDASGGVYGGSFDNAPYVAFGYMRTFKNSNIGLYVWILKMRFAPSNFTADTKPTDGITPQYDSLSGGCVTREADSAWIYSVKSSDPNFAATFFTQATLQKLAAASTPDVIALSESDPEDNETPVAVNEDITLTFNNTIAYDHVSLLKADGTVVAATKTYDTTGKILTITPDVNMSASTVYIVAINGVTDIHGQTLAAAAINFETAS